MEALPGIWSLSPLAALIGVLVLNYWLQATGKLITKSSQERELAQAYKYGDEWKATALLERVVSNEQREQIGKLIESNRISDHFYNEFFPGSIADTNPNPRKAVGNVA